jgi:catechol 2,3-dioxygenase-like lactoylglutathione lyase family enzyme
VTEVNHVGVTVSDIDAAVEWYKKVFGLELMAGPMDCSLHTIGAERRLDVFGEQWGAMKLAHLMTSNGAGIELFQFLEPPVESLEDNFTYWRVGPHHVGLTVDDFDGTLRLLLEEGGLQRTAVFDVYGGALIAYCSDPWGNTLEIVSKSYRDLSDATTQS